MNTYLGFIEKKNSEPTVFFNFKPIARIEDSGLHILTGAEQAELLPESEKRDINFSYVFNSTEHRIIMDDYFSQRSLAVFDFVLADLQANTRANGERNPTGYKVLAIDMIEMGRIRHIHASKIYHVIKKNELLSDFYNDSIVEIEAHSILAGEEVFVELDDFWAGPYVVGYRKYTSSFYIKPQIKENKYTISGYARGDYMLQELTSSGTSWNSPDYRWSVLIPRKTAELVRRDVISNEALLESFRESVENTSICNGSIQIADIPSLLKHYEESVLTGMEAAEDIRRHRLNRLANILTSEADVDGTLNTVSGVFCELLIKYKDNPNVERWLRAVLEKHPEFIEQLRDSRIITDKITQLEQNLEELQARQEEMDREIELKRETAQSIDQAAIEAKKTELLKMDAEYAELSDKLAALQKTVGLAGDISRLQGAEQKYRADIEHLEWHKKRLEMDAGTLETQFIELINKPHEKMLEIAFDGFMSSKMLRAAEQWESEAGEREYFDLVTNVNEISVPEKSPEQLVDYLCAMVQTVRPQYNRNTIVNIAICLTQGFLTVFSGEPGCGKTSICNIIAEVLGLNRIGMLTGCDGGMKENANRYISVSVERGWTSKQDFIGYYNPLSKSFDKSNRRVYDALHQLNIEKRENLSKFPFFILLDEANLSPMEYYWADFMNICDDLGSQSEVSLGDSHVFSIPETLHFLATINNDHTTETLSPRLIDRAWIISLPQQFGPLSLDNEMRPDQIEMITWESLKKAFIPQNAEAVFSADIQKIYDMILTHLRKGRFSVSPRAEIAIRRYWAVASKRFEKDETETDASIVALDYAVAQRILPKILGNGEEFERWLEEFKSLCSGHGLNISAKLLRDIIDRGNQQMKYYQFFC